MATTVDPVPRLESALGVSPFPWQTRLLHQLLEGQPPTALDLPTGLGKTSVMAIWLVARSLGAPHLPRRLIYVVDRRAVVDQATAEAERLRGWVETSLQVRQELGLDGKLPISTLRGQFVDNREWLEDPTRPSIVVGTVDMIGSRILFEGYACSRKMRPYHAAMLGNDTLVVLDEAHLVPPFERLLEQIAAGTGFGPRDATAVAVLCPPRLLCLSATRRATMRRTVAQGADTNGPVTPGAAEPVETALFTLDASDHDHPVVQQRLGATKRIGIEVVDGKDMLAEVLAERAWHLATRSGSPVRVVVFSNRRDDAAAAKDHLETKVARDDAGKKIDVRTELFVGARRVRERQLAAEVLGSLGFLAGSAPPEENVFLFATSAAEVGVDLDADHMVCDVVPWERMVQRLGRVNRRGQGSADVVVLAHDVDDSQDQNERIAALIELLPSLDGSVGPDGGVVHDGSPAALGRLRDEHGRAVADASTPAPLYPGLDRALLDAWSMTSLEAHTGRPEVQPWLRGWIEEEPQTEVVWRCLFPPQGAPAVSLARFFEAAPPHTSERLESRTDRVMSWLLGRIKRLPGSEDELGQEWHVDSTDLVAYALNRAGELLRTWTRRDLENITSSGAKRRFHRELSGAILVVDARLSGLDANGLLDEKMKWADLVTVESESWMPTPTTGERPAVPFRVRVVRADPLPAGPLQGEIPVTTRPSTSDSGDPNWFETYRLARALANDESVESWLVVEKWRHEATSEEGRAAGRPQKLDEHQEWAAKEASRIAEGVGLSQSLTHAVVLAATLHDEGKRSDRWQRAFAAPADGSYAKTKGPVNVRLLDGYRHELGSLLAAQKDDRVLALDDHERDLVLHLIAAHHGFSRPLIRTEGCDDAPPSALTGVAREIAMRFFRLQERYGPWGLAWLETLVRAADQIASRRNDEAEGGR